MAGKSSCVSSSRRERRSPESFPSSRLFLPPLARGSRSVNAPRPPNPALFTRKSICDAQRVGVISPVISTAAPGHAEILGDRVDLAVTVCLALISVASASSLSLRRARRGRDRVRPWRRASQARRRAQPRLPVMRAVMVMDGRIDGHGPWPSQPRRLSIPATTLGCHNHDPFHPSPRPWLPANPFHPGHDPGLPQLRPFPSRPGPRGRGPRYRGRGRARSPNDPGVLRRPRTISRIKISGNSDSAGNTSGV